MNTNETLLLLETTKAGILLGVPVMVLVWPRFPEWPRRVGWRVAYTILTVGVLLNAHRYLFWDFRFRLAETRATFDIETFEVGGTIGYFLDWVKALAVALLALVLGKLLERVANGKRRKDRIAGV